MKQTLVCFERGEFVFFKMLKESQDTYLKALHETFVAVCLLYQSKIYLKYLQMFFNMAPSFELIKNCFIEK